MDKGQEERNRKVIDLLRGPSSGLRRGVPGAEETTSPSSWAGLPSLEASESSDELENVRPGIAGLRRGLRYAGALLRFLANDEAIFPLYFSGFPFTRTALYVGDGIVCWALL